MSKSAQDSLSLWVARHTLVVWIGILLNQFLILPLIFAPVWLLDTFNLPLEQTVWARLGGMLLLIITIFYIPVTFDLDRYRVFAWLAIFPSRTFGTVFFFLAVFAFGHPPGFLVVTLLDGTIAVLSLICLIRVTKLEHERRFSGERFLGDEV